MDPNTMATSETREEPIINYIEQPWSIIESYFRDQHLEKLVRHQLESYNNFVNH